MAVKHGSLSINSENIFPIIKKWLYSDHDIFVRELVSNGCDAITKLKKLEVMGEYTFPEGYKPEIQVIVNPDEKTLKFIDNGIGMTADEVEKYITQIAFSGATQFLEKYKDKTTDDQMIGHFGLGFYSAFMVADEVHIDTLSYTEGAQPVHWSCDGGTEYDIQEGNKNTIGTEITLFLNEDCLEFANEYRMREILEKYCSFMPVEIFLSKENAEKELRRAFEEQGLRGLYINTARLHIYPYDKKLIPLYDICQQYNRPIIFQSGLSLENNAFAKYCRPVDFEEVLYRYPDANMCLTHVGWPWVQETASLLLKYKNCYTDTALMNFDGPYQIYKKVFTEDMGKLWVEHNIADKILFGSGSPRIRPVRSKRGLDSLGFSEETLEKIYWKNAEDFLRQGE